MVNRKEEVILCLGGVRKRNDDASYTDFTIDPKLLTHLRGRKVWRLHQSILQIFLELQVATCEHIAFKQKFIPRFNIRHFYYQISQENTIICFMRVSALINCYINLFKNIYRLGNDFARLVAIFFVCVCGSVYKKREVKKGKLHSLGWKRANILLLE